MDGKPGVSNSKKRRRHQRWSRQTLDIYFFPPINAQVLFLNSLAKNLADFENKRHIDIETYLATNPQKRDELYASKSF